MYLQNMGQMLRPGICPALQQGQIQEADTKASLPQSGGKGKAPGE